MEKVASHINEMQKIYEDYGCVFDQLVAEQSGADKQVHSLKVQCSRSHQTSWKVNHHSILSVSTGNGDLHGRVSGPLLSGLVEPYAMSATSEEGASANVVW